MPVQMVAGVPSFCAVAAKLSVSLTSMDKPLHIIPAVHADLNECMQWPGTKVLMKTGSKMPQVRAF